jgi:hypothetical protein
MKDSHGQCAVSIDRGLWVELTKCPLLQISQKDLPLALHAKRWQEIQVDPVLAVPLFFPSRVRLLHSLTLLTMGGHQVSEFREQVTGIKWSGGRLRMILHAKKRQFSMAKTFQCVIIQIEVSDLDFPFRERIQVNGKTMILGCDLDLSS